MKKLEQCSLAELTDYAQRVWAAKTIEAKRVILEDACAKFTFKGKTKDFVVRIRNEKNPTKLDSFVGNLVLLESGDRVIY